MSFPIGTSDASWEGTDPGECGDHDENTIDDDTSMTLALDKQNNGSNRNQNESWNTESTSIVNSKNKNIKFRKNRKFINQFSNLIRQHDVEFERDSSYDNNSMVDYNHNGPSLISNRNTMQIPNLPNLSSKSTGVSVSSYGSNNHINSNINTNMLVNHGNYMQNQNQNLNLFFSISSSPLSPHINDDVQSNASTSALSIGSGGWQPITESTMLQLQQNQLFNNNTHANLNDPGRLIRQDWMDIYRVTDTHDSASDSNSVATSLFVEVESVDEGGSYAGYGGSSDSDEDTISNATFDYVRLTTVTQSRRKNNNRRKGILVRSQTQQLPTSHGHSHIHGSTIMNHNGTIKYMGGTSTRTTSVDGDSVFTRTNTVISSFPGSAQDDYVDRGVAGDIEESDPGYGDADNEHDTNIDRSYCGEEDDNTMEEAPGLVGTGGTGSAGVSSLGTATGGRRQQCEKEGDDDDDDDDGGYEGDAASDSHSDRGTVAHSIIPNSHSTKAWCNTHSRNSNGDFDMCTDASESRCHSPSMTSVSSSVRTIPTHKSVHSIHSHHRGDHHRGDRSSVNNRSSEHSTLAHTGLGLHHNAATKLSMITGIGIGSSGSSVPRSFLSSNSSTTSQASTSSSASHCQSQHSATGSVSATRLSYTPINISSLSSVPVIAGNNNSNNSIISTSNSSTRVNLHVGFANNNTIHKLDTFSSHQNTRTRVPSGVSIPPNTFGVAGSLVLNTNNQLNMANIVGTNSSTSSGSNTPRTISTINTNVISTSNQSLFRKSNTYVTMTQNELIDTSNDSLIASSAPSPWLTMKFGDNHSARTGMTVTSIPTFTSHDNSCLNSTVVNSSINNSNNSNVNNNTSCSSSPMVSNNKLPSNCNSIEVSTSQLTTHNATSIHDVSTLPSLLEKRTHDDRDIAADVEYIHVVDDNNNSNGNHHLNNELLNIPSNRGTSSSNGVGGNSSGLEGFDSSSDSNEYVNDTDASSSLKNHHPELQLTGSGEALSHSHLRRVKRRFHHNNSNSTSGTALSSSSSSSSNYQR